MSGGFFRGTSADQDTRFSNKQAKLLKSQKFAPELEHLVDMTKVQMDAIRPWIAKRVTELLGFEDEVLINFIYGLLEGKEVNGKEVQISLTGFMEKNTGKFMKELWERLLSAQTNPSGVAQQDLDAKAEDLRRKKAEDERLVKDIQTKKDKESNESVRERERNMDEGYDRKAFDSDVEPSSKHARRKMSTEKADEDVDVKIRNGFRRKRSRSRSVSKALSNSRSHASDRWRSRSLSGSAELRQRSVSDERVHPSPRKRSITPHSRHSPRSSLSPPRRRSSFYRRSRSRSPRRSISLSHRRLSSPYRRRSPSPYRRRSPFPARRYRSPSPARRRRSPTPPRRHRRRSRTPPHWRRSPTPPGRRRSPSRDRRRSPSLTRYRRSPSPVRRRRSPSPVRRRRSPSPARRHRSPSLPRRRRRSPSFDRRRRSPSPYQRDRSPPPYKNRRLLSPDQRGRSESPARSSKSFSPNKSLSPMSPIRKSPVAVSQLRRHRSPPPASRSPTVNRSISLVTSPRKSVRHISPTSGTRNSVSPAKGRSSASPSRLLQISLKEPRSHRKLEQSSPRPVQTSSRFRERFADEDGRELSGKGVHPRTPDQQRSSSVQDSLVGGKGFLPQLSDDKGSVELNNPQKNNAHGSDEHNEAETASLLVRKVDRKNRSVDSDSEENDRHKRKRKRKHKRSERKEASSDDSYDSELDDRKEAKRKKKEERRLRKEEKRRRREERRRRREERRAEKLKMKDLDDSNVSDVEHTGRGSHRSNDEEAESERKKLEFELRQKALESLKAKKGISS